MALKVPHSLKKGGDTFGVGICSNGKILSNVKEQFKTTEGGIRPILAAHFHRDNAIKVIETAMKKAGVEYKELKGIAYAIGPGLGPCLQIGAVTARTLAQKLKIPLIGVNHCIAHIEVGLATTKAKSPVVIYASGGNTQIIHYSKNKYHIYGETLDTGVGNLLDTYGRFIGIGFPGGPTIDKWSQKNKRKYLTLPYTIKGTDIAFSGLLNSAKLKTTKKNKKDISYSMMMTACCMVAESAERVMANLKVDELMLVGGVGASKTFQNILKKMCEERNAKFYVPKIEYLLDNGAMIALTGEIMLKAKQTVEVSEPVTQRYRIDEPIVNWK